MYPSSKCRLVTVAHFAVTPRKRVRLDPDPFSEIKARSALLAAVVVLLAGFVARLLAVLALLARLTLLLAGLLARLRLVLVALIVLVVLARLVLVAHVMNSVGVGLSQPYF